MPRRLTSSALSLIPILLLLGCLSGCGTCPQRLADAAGRAAIHPATWLPAAGALALQIDDWDDNLATWATRHNPVFGTESNADTAGDVLTVGLAASGVGSGYLLSRTEQNPAYDELLADGSALGGSALATLGLKGMVNRTRPDGSDRDSFPSGHSAVAVSGAVLTCQHLQHMNLTQTTRTVAQGSAILGASLAGWARVEAGEHYASDVLAGAALGNFLTHVAHDTLLPEQTNTQISINPTTTGWIVGLSVDY